VEDAPAVAVLPVGFQQFHRRRFINYQLNRAHGLGFADADELRAAALEVRHPRDGASAFDRLSRHAEAQGRIRHATSYMRVAEFFTPPGSADKPERYRRDRALFDAGFMRDGLERHDVPYDGASLPAYTLPASGGSPARGTVVVHGGFDSLIEEFYAVWQRLSAAGFDVIAFDGPGQGGALALQGIHFDHDWERPVGALLDHFEARRASLIGMSMGGYWALRAASRERRIARVVAWPPVYDWMLRVPPLVRPAARRMVARRGFMRWSVRTRARLIPTLRHVVDPVGYLTGSDDPYDVVTWFLGMNPDHLGSDEITQDVLLLLGENDAFQPPHLGQAQAGALTHAASVTTHLFTADDHADQHCQMGNVDLACRVVTDWLARKV